MPADLRELLDRDAHWRAVLAGRTVRPTDGLPDRAVGPSGPHVVHLLAGDGRPGAPPCWYVLEDPAWDGVWFVGYAPGRGFGLPGSGWVAAYAPAELAWP